jgi:spore maturation protein CgeB
VFDGLLYGLRYHGIEVETYRLDTRIEASHKALYWLWRTKSKTQPDLARPNHADVMYHAGVGVLEMALRKQSDVVLIVSAMLQHPDSIVMMKRAGLRVVVLFTETPYDLEHELKIAKLVDGCWTNERTSVPAFREVNKNASYIPHGWHPLKHTTLGLPEDADLPSHDVVFVGSGFPDRIAFFNNVDWNGIDLGLYGNWGKHGKGLGLNARARACLKGENVANEQVAGLYRRAKIGLNLYRSFGGWGRSMQRVTGAESLSPRAYELAACGQFHLSEYRKEVGEVFGELVPTFTTPAEAEALIRHWLEQPAERARLASELPACVAESSWVQRARAVIGDLQRLLESRAA